MAVPTTYTESGLKQFMRTSLGTIATSLSWTDLSDYDEPYNDALLAFGTTDISTISGVEEIRQIRALARLAVWRQVLTELSQDYDFKTIANGFSRSQAFDHAKQMFAMANAEALEFDASWEVKIDSVTFGDYYQPLEASESA